MDHERFDDLDLDLDLDLGDVGLPPVEELEPAPERGPAPLPAAADPEVPWLTPVILVTMCAFGGLSMLIMTSGGSGGPAQAWLLGGSFAALYVVVLWAGSALIGAHRYR